jgi:hypothetical protein
MISTPVQEGQTDETPGAAVLIRLKLIKRQMYSGASFDPLRLRVLNPAQLRCAQTRLRSHPPLH